MHRRLVSGGPDQRTHIDVGDGRTLCGCQTRFLQLALTGQPTCRWCILVDSQQRREAANRASGNKR